MNCLAYRRALLEEPLREDPLRQEHASRCPTCRRFGEGVRELERQLGGALAIEVPRSLAERLGHHAPPPRRRLTRLLLPWLVPSLVALSAVALYLPWQHRQELASIHRRSLQPDPGPLLDEAGLREELAAFGLVLRTPPPPTLRARPIELNGAPALQLQLRHEGRPASVLIYAGSPLATPPGAFVEDDVIGLVRETRGGRMAVLGLTEAASERLLARLFVTASPPR